MRSKDNFFRLSWSMNNLSTISEVGSQTEAESIEASKTKVRLQTWKPQKLKEKLIGNHKETQNTLKISGLFHFTRLVQD